MIEWFKTQFESRRSEPEHRIFDAHMLDQCYVSLHAAIDKFRHQDEIKKKHSEQLKEIEEALSQARSWDAAFYLEQAIVPMLCPEEVRVEFKEKMMLLRQQLTLREFREYEPLERSKSVEDQRAGLRVVTEQLQWRHRLKRLRFEYIRKVRHRTDALFIFSVLLLLVPSVLLILPQVNPTNSVSYATSLHMLVAVASGMMGAMFSILSNLTDRVSKSSIDDLRIMHTYGFLFSRAILGIGAGLIFFYLIRAEMIGGTLFPDLTKDIASDAGELSITADFAKRVIWGVIAGFSERMIPNILSMAEKNVALETGEQPAPKPASSR